MSESIKITNDVMRYIAQVGEITVNMPLIKSHTAIYVHCKTYYTYAQVGLGITCPHWYLNEFPGHLLIHLCENGANHNCL